MSAALAAIVERCYRAALERVQAGHAVAEQLRWGDGALEIGGRRYDVEHGLYAGLEGYREGVQVSKSCGRVSGYPPAALAIAG